ncbi:MAG: helicase-related protein, partial [Thermomicrobiales bacterium]
MTATATPGMVAQIGRALGRDLQLVRTSVFRPNLTYEVRQVENREAKLAEIVRVCKAERGVGIVYVSSRKDTEIIASILRGRGVEAAPYHAGLDPETRARNQEQFMSGRTRVIVATVAFGMGIDKADVRFIVHVSPPKSLEAYAQESGRAGRDGEPARCILLVGPTDQSTLNKLNRRDEISIESLRGVYSMFRRAAHGSWVILDQATLRPSYDEDAADPRVALGLLEQAGLLRRHPDAPADYSVRSQRRLAAAAPVDGNGPAAAVERWLAARLGTAGSASFATTDACAELDVSPVALDRALADIEWAVVREGSRGVCLQLLTPDGDAGSTMIRLLEQSRLDAEARVRSVMGYAKGRQCRHAMIAAHFGEAIEPCGDRCDVCLDAVAPVGAAVDAKRSGSTLGADDALAVLTGLRTLPFPVGKAGLVRLLMGSEESRIRADRSVSFGVFAKTPKTKVEALVERLVEDGFIVRDVDHEYRLLSLSGKGQQAAVDDLAAYASQSPRSSAPGNAPHGTIDDDSPQGRLLADLTAWRRRQASEESVPAYVVAYNIMLENLAATRPATKAALLAVPGMGPVRVEKYGEQLLRIIAESQA